MSFKFMLRTILFAKEQLCLGIFIRNLLEKCKAIHLIQWNNFF